jgi:ribose transport system ATP-binding protein
VREFSPGRIIELMVGRSLDEQFPRVPHRAGEPILELTELVGDRLPRGVSLTLHRGEILGVAGIVGAGRSELLRAIFGLEPVRRGRVKVKNYSGAAATPRRRIAQGVGLLSEDRKREGLALDQSIADNLTYSRLAPYGRFGWLNLKHRRQAVADWLTRLRIRYREQDQPVGDLSGGNQQKVALGRLLHQEADVLLLDEPTRGVDIASKAEIYRLIGELAARGKAVLFVSSYLPELLGISDRLAVMARGRLSPVRAISDWAPEQVMTYATSGAAQGERS